MTYPMAPEAVVWDEADVGTRIALCTKCNRSHTLAAMPWRELMQFERDALRDAVLAHLQREQYGHVIPHHEVVHTTSARPRPAVRANVTNELRVGKYKLFVTTACYPDGLPMELFVDLGHEGSMARGLMDAIARQVSRGWQHGVPVTDTIDQFLGTKFEPGGMGEGHPAIEGRMCDSLLDAIARVLAAEFNVPLGGDQ